MKKEEIIELLKDLKNREANLKLKEIEKKKKEIELNKIKEEYNINITPVYMHGGKANKISSKVENTVINKCTDIEILEKELKEIEENIEILKLELEEINVRLTSLTYIEKEILIDRFVNEMSYDDIGNITYYRIKQQTREYKAIKRIIDNALSKLQKIS